jgi:hypothetical protein
MIEAGVFVAVVDIAGTEKIDPSYVSRILQLTLLAPDIVDAILNGRQPRTLSLASAIRPFLVEWDN